MKVLIIEDEPVAIDGIINILRNNFNDISDIHFAQSIKDGIDKLSSNKYDLIISDIHLTDGLSFELLGTITSHVPIIFTTAYDQYALKAFEYNGIAYVLKPIHEKKLVSAIEKAKEIYINNTGIYSHEIINMLEKFHKKENFKRRFCGKIGNKVVFLSTDEISLFYVEDKLVFMKEANGNKKYIVNYSLEELESNLLDPDKFYRINRSVIINLDYLHEMKNYTNGRLSLSVRNGTPMDLIVARERVSQFREWLNQ